MRSPGLRSAPRVRQHLAPASLTALLVTGMLMIAVAIAADRTVLSPRFYTGVLSEADAYGRIYSEVLRDPALVSGVGARPQEIALARPAALGALRLLAPPEALAQAADVAAAWWVDALRGVARGPAAVDGGTLQSGIADYLVRRIAEPAPDAREQLGRMVGDLAGALAGRQSVRVPVLDEGASALLARALGNLGGGEAIGAARMSAGLRALAPDRLAALAGPRAAAGRAWWSTAEGEWRRLTDREESPLAGAGTVLWVATRVAPVLGLVLVAAGGAGGCLLARRRGTSALRWLARSLLAAGGTVGAALLALHVAAPAFAQRAVAASPVPLPPAADALARDVLAIALREVAWSAAPVAAGCAAGALVLLAAPLVRAAWRRRLDWAVISRTWRQTAQAGSAGLVLLAPFAAPLGGPQAAGGFGAHAGPETAVLGCNGLVELCDRRVDEVFFAGTHNSMSAASLRWVFPAQDAAIPQQLEAGYRALLLDTHTWAESRAPIDGLREELTPDQRGVLDTLLSPFEADRPGTYLCHGYCGFGATPLVEGLRQVNEFLDAHPREVVLLFMEDYISVADTRAALVDSGLFGRVYAGGGPWPTLGALIERDERVLVFSEHTRDGPAWYHSQRRFVRESGMAAPDAEAPTCRLRRGRDTHRLVLLKHWAPTLPSDPANAERLNAREAIAARVAACGAAETQGMVVAVDFGETGDVVAAVRELNRRDTPAPPAVTRRSLAGAARGAATLLSRPPVALEAAARALVSR
ncbi:MAG: hypothetical protein AB7G21_04240 [Dehalococcoidia bacterium]